MVSRLRYAVQGGTFKRLLIRFRDLGTPARELDWKFELEIVEGLYHIFYSGILEYIMSLFAKRILPIFLKHFFTKLETPMSC
jgi:hypothetical protein